MRAKPPFEGTYYSDKAATHTVEVLGGGLGGGIYGYYTSEFAAHAVARWARQQGAQATVVCYDSEAPVVGGVHSLAAAFMQGY